jgi:cytochrome c oxidase subunit 1/cytochrome c oxidase subunit I+III
MHILGLLGMPRRIYTYHEGLGWDALNMLCTVGAFILTAGLVLFTLNVARTLKFGRRAGDNPWNASTLEWATSSPPEAYNFARIPVVRSADPLWEPGTDDAPGAADARAYLGQSHGERESLATTPLDADPNRIIDMPGDSMLPPLLALSFAAMVISLLNDFAIGVIAGVIVAIATCAAWTWPEKKVAK